MQLAGGAAASKAAGLDVATTAHHFTLDATKS
jgi:hypothetical protein